MINSIEFKAGILNFDTISKKVSADKRLGKVLVFHVKLVILRILKTKNIFNG